MKTKFDFKTHAITVIKEQSQRLGVQTRHHFDPFNANPIGIDLESTQCFPLLVRVTVFAFKAIESPMKSALISNDIIGYQ